MHFTWGIEVNKTGTVLILWFREAFNKEEGGAKGNKVLCMCISNSTVNDSAKRFVKKCASCKGRLRSGRQRRGERKDWCRKVDTSEGIGV